MVTVDFFFNPVANKPKVKLHFYDNQGKLNIVGIP